MEECPAIADPYTTFEEVRLLEVSASEEVT